MIRAALGQPGYRRYFLGNVFALNATWLMRVTVGWLAWDLTGQAGFVGLAAFLAFAPTLVSGPFFGVLADRIDLRLAALATQAGHALAAGALLAASLAGLLTPAVLAAFALAVGIVASAHHPIRLTLGPALVPRSAIAAAVTLGSVNFNLARLTGPALGGLLIARAGVDWALAATAAGFLPLLVVLPGLELRRAARTAARRPGLVAALGDGVRHAAAAPLIRRAMLVTLLFSLVGRGLIEILPVLADGIFARGPAGLGALTAAAGAGALAAAAILAFGSGQRPGRLPRRSSAAAVAGTALVAGVAWTTSWPLALGLVAALGLCGTFVGVGLQSAVQLVLPDDYRGRVMSLWTMVAVGGSALGALGLGGLADLVGLRAALTASSLAALAGLAIVLARPLAPAPDPAALPAQRRRTEPCPGDREMTVTRDTVLDALRAVEMPGTGTDIVAADTVRALSVEGGTVRFVLEVPAERGAALEPVRAAAQAAVEALPGVTAVSALMTAHGPAPRAAPPAGPAPSLKIGRHPAPQAGPAAVPGVRQIIAVASGKGGVGKSTLAANLAVALALEGKLTGLLDADIYGPSVPRMMGVSERPKSSDGKTIIPLHAHGVTVMSIGLMLQEGQAVVWRGPMLMGALQQMMGQVAWGELDALIVDLPPGTGDVQLTLSQKYPVTGAIVVSTPQDVALIDVRKAMDMFDKTKVPVLGLVENMSTYICPNCGHEEHIFGEGGVQAEAARLGLPFLGAVPINVGIRLCGDAGTPIVALEPDAPESRSFRAIARRLIDGGIV